MDDDTLRRGRPTLHVVYGDGIAILAGDGLHAEAFTLLAREPATSDPTIVGAEAARRSRSSARRRAPAGMVGGQAIDLQAAGQAPGHAVTLDAEGLRAMHARKTGALIRASAVSGAIMAGAADDLVAADRSIRRRDRPGVSDRRRHPRRRRRSRGARQDRRQGRRRRQADLSRALRPRAVARARRRMPAARASRALTDARPDRRAGSGAIADWVVTRRS